MEKIKLNFRNKPIELECDNASEVRNLAVKYNARVLDFSNSPKVSDAKVALVTGIKMEYEIEKLKQQKDESNSDAELAETLDHITMYLNSLTTKLESA